MSTSKLRTVGVRLTILLSVLIPHGSAQSFATASEGDTSGEPIRIASFNIKVFGQKKVGKADVMRVLSDIVRKYDIVAVQEIKDRKGEVLGEVPGLFLEAINDGTNAYGVLVSDRTGKEDDDKHSREQYAYYYRTSTIAVLDEGVLYDDSQSGMCQ